jgi:hypothetical protein
MLPVGAADEDADGAEGCKLCVVVYESGLYTNVGRSRA